VCAWKVGYEVKILKPSPPLSSPPSWILNRRLDTELLESAVAVEILNADSTPGFAG
jgi:hypothetical protein